jgi:hypothetical protein
MRVKPLIAIPLIAIALAGCSTQQPPTLASATTAEEKPLFSSDEEALAAAQAAYAHYLEVSDQIARDGGANPERLKGLVSPSLYEDETAGFEQIVTSGLTATGNSTFDTIHLQGLEENKIKTYLCIDHSQIHLLDSSQTDVTSATRVERFPLVVSFISNPRGNLIIESSETWSGKNFCL